MQHLAECAICSERDKRFSVLTSAVPYAEVLAVLRLIHLEVKYHGVSSEDLYVWKQHPFPHLRDSIEIRRIAARLNLALHYPGDLCTPQIVWQLPDEGNCDLTPHQDVPAEGRQIGLIVGVALTEWNADNGSLRVWHEGEPAPRIVQLNPGDAVLMTGDQLHSPGLNRGGTIRCGLYFRFLVPQANP